MRIGIDATCWSNRRGYGRYARELIGALTQLDEDDEYWLFVDTPTAPQCRELVRAPHVRLVEIETVQAPTEAASADGRRSIRDLWAMGDAVRRCPGLDLFFFPSVYTYFPILSSRKTIVTIHDAIPEHYPEHVFPSRQSRLFWNLKVRCAIWQSALITTVSETAKRDIVGAFHLDARRVRVIPDAVDTTFRPLSDTSVLSRTLERYQLSPDQRIVLYVGGMSPHKNLEALVDAFGELVQTTCGQDIQLVLAGDVDQDVFYSSYPRVRQRIVDSGLSGRVVWTGFVPDSDLVCLYNAAEVLVLPSFDEGFGLPALEAMACGTPVVASRAGALPEVVGQAGLYFDPHDARELAQRLREVLADDRLRGRLAHEARCRARQYSWERSAHAAMETFTEIAGVREPSFGSTREQA
jgi:glycosyltransferase involved in cell wall biosynthesis